MAVHWEVIMLFSDISKAYDNLSSLKLCQALCETIINETIIKSVYELYKCSYIKIIEVEKSQKNFQYRKVESKAGMMLYIA